MPLVFAPDERPDDDEAAGGPALASQALWVGWSDAVEIEVPQGIDGGAEVHLLRETPRVLGLHRNDVPTTWAGQRGVETFDDRKATNYYDATNPTGSTLTAGSGVTLTVSGETRDRMNIHVKYSK